ncbi:alcohol dehydrogenase [Putridiphycobacter roseus]|uniref:Alcohol dehydrogenase n=1 Tax=Putridiphycobacter roseus TaxID=2219161 RepID=A0A2W1NDX0_9FLAO|nr:zinc-binding dehydrogenase [Putridiphycobacter roseus]PZE17303.1 alcohol dehydrogenase [Putridiphycobacter roseus]
MKAVFLVKEGNAAQAFEIRETAKPSIAFGDDILIKVEAFGLNYADVMARHGQYKEAPPLPSIIGYEVVGIIEAVGKDIDQNLIGKRVVGFTRFGGYAEYAITKSFGMVVVDDMEAGIALSIATQYVTAYYMAYQATNLMAGDKVMIHAGAGGVGTALIQLCKLKGCEIYANAGSQEKLDYIKKQGADHVINYRTHDYAAEINKLLPEERLDCTFNPIAGSTYKKDFGLIGSGGRVILFGGSELSGTKFGILSSLNFIRKMGFLLPIGLMMRSKSIIGVNMLKIGDNKPKLLHKCLQEVTQLIKDGKVHPHIGGTFNVADVAKAHEFLGSRNSIGKVIVNW